MATFKAIVEPHYKRADGTYNVRIRITHNRRTKLISTQLYVTAEDLTRPSLKIKTPAFIEATENIIKQYRNICNGIGERLKLMSVEEVVGLIKDDYNPRKTFDLDFIDYGRGVAQKLKAAGREGSAKLYNVTLNSLIKFNGTDKININDITVQFLNSYVAWINAQPATSTRVKGARAASLYMSYIRALHNMAKAEYNDEDTGVIRIPLSPFAKIKFPKAPTTRKQALPINIIQKIIELPYVESKPRYNLAKDVFILSFCMFGMNSADLYSCSTYRDRRVIYQRAKTKNRRDDNAEISIRIEPQFAPLFEKYRDSSNDRLFCFHQHYSTPSTFNAAINKALKEVGKIIEAGDLKFYAARHSWATIARNDAKIEMHTVHAALNHVDNEMKITDIYIKKDWSLIDEANEKVLSLFDFSRMPTNNPEER